MAIAAFSTQILDEIVKLICAYKKPEKIVVFGSRAKHNFRDTSDIDIAIFGKSWQDKDINRDTSDIDIAIFGKSWQDKDINIVKNILDESLKTPLKIDVLNFYAITKQKLKENILKEGRVLYES